MFELTVHATFNATHALVMYDGQREPVHGHDWRVTAVVAAAELDDHAMVMDFHALHTALQAIVEPLHHTALNDHAIIGRANASAEAVARYIADTLAARLPEHVTLRSISITEAPSCVATYRPA